MPSAAAFNPNAGLALRLPRCPAPRCHACKSELRDVRPFRTEQLNASTTIVECLAKCGRCGTKHAGTRRLQSTPQGSRFVGQSFELWTDEHETSLKPVATALSAAAAPVPRTAKASAKPVQIIPIKVSPPKTSPAKRRRLSWRLASAAAAALALSTCAYLYLF